MEIYTLSDLGKYIKQVVALNFVDTIWISCELSQVNTSRGHCYLNVVEKNNENDDVIASMNASIWYKDFMFIRKKLGAVADKILQEGMEVKLKVEVDFHERYGMKLIVKDIDPSFTFGQLAINREKIIEQLKAENRLNLNRGLPFPSVVQRIAVISSETAAGLKDMMDHLERNQYGYDFQIKLFPAAMQGQRTEMEVIAQLREIKELNNFDVIVITRGGGSKLDLAGFDSYPIAKEISEMNIPVIAGIGHEIDTSIVDIISAVSLKTPTAVANFLIDLNAAFETDLYNVFIDIKFSVEKRIQKEKGKLDIFYESLNSASILHLNNLTNEIESIHKMNTVLASNRLKILHQEIESIAKMIHIVDPIQLLKKGYAIPQLNGKNINSIHQVNKEDILTLQLSDGSIKTKVQ